METPCLRKVAQKMKTLFVHTTLRESPFSDMKLTKSIMKIRLKDAYLEDCMAVAVLNYSPCFSAFTTGQC